MSRIVDPTRLFEIRGQVCPLKTLAQNPAIGSNNILLLGAANNKIRIMGWNIQSLTTTAGSFTLRSGSGGNIISAFLTVPPNTNGLVDRLPIVDSGYMETDAGADLIADVFSSTLGMTIFYLMYAV